MLAAEALMDDVASATQSCAADVWPGVPCAPQCLQSPPTPRTVAAAASSSSACWVERVLSSSEAAESEGR
eukprot:9998844-Lingulodinium_polyedra.AAC.1